MPPDPAVPVQSQVKEGANDEVPARGIADPADPRPDPGGLGGAGVGLGAADDWLSGGIRRHDAAFGQVHA